MWTSCARAGAGSHHEFSLELLPQRSAPFSTLLVVPAIGGGGRGKIRKEGAVLHSILDYSSA